MSLTYLLPKKQLPTIRSSDCQDLKIMDIDLGSKECFIDRLDNSTATPVTLKGQHVQAPSAEKSNNGLWHILTPQIKLFNDIDMLLRCCVNILWHSSEWWSRSHNISKHSSRSSLKFRIRQVRWDGPIRRSLIRSLKKQFYSHLQKHP